MEAYFNKFWCFITLRLMLLLLLVGGCGVFLTLAMLRWYDHTQLMQTAFPESFLTHLVEQLPQPHSTPKIQNLLSNTQFILRIEQASQWWGMANVPAYAQLHLVRQRDQHTGYYIDNDGTPYYVITKGDRYFIFANRFVCGDQSHSLWLLLVSLLVVLLILLGYFIAGRFFIPINWIKNEALRIGKGDLSYRIPYQRKDQLGQLVEIINKMAEDLERIFDSKRQLLLAISHELRSPLTRMKLNVALLDESRISGRLTDDIDDMRDIVEGLLESERLQGKHTAIDKSTVDAQQLICEIVGEYSSEANIELNFQRPLATIVVDVAKFKFLVRNLINNALNYTDANQRKIKVTGYLERQNFCIQVSDNGIGIKQEYQYHLFSPFYRADQSRRRETGGVGLGLYLCLLIARAHGGNIELNTQQGKGSCFVAHFPQNISNDQSI